MAKHILVVSQYFFPENFRINDICLEWIKRGYKVTVLTGIPNYPVGYFYQGYGICKRRKENYHGINIIRIPIISRGKRTFRLILNYLSFVLSGWFWKIFTPIRADIVFNFEVSPLSQALPAIWYAKKRKIPSYIYIQDLWPDNVEIVGGIHNKRVIKLIEKMAKYIYMNATKILVTSQSFKDTIIKRGVDSNKVIYWPQYAEDFDSVTEIANEYLEFFTIMFTGNIGTAQGLDILPKVAVVLKDNGYQDRLKFILVGDGRNKTTLQMEIQGSGVESMFIFVGQQLPQDIPSHLKCADVAFLSFSDNELFRMTIPAKLQTYLSCSKPVLAVASGETKNIVQETNCGVCCDPGDVKKLYENILYLMGLEKNELQSMGNKGFQYSRIHFNKKSLMDEMDLLISEELDNV